MNQQRQASVVFVAQQSGVGESQCRAILHRVGIEVWGFRFIRGMMMFCVKAKDYSHTMAILGGYGVADEDANQPANGQVDWNKASWIIITAALLLKAVIMGLLILLWLYEHGVW
jgi:hypothetical protein